jgi:nucleotide-binding universal stress UspA family protein
VQRVVVGVDGSEGSRRALWWAAEEAALRGARLEVIHAYGLTEGIENVGGATRAEQRFGDAGTAARDLVDDMTAVVEAAVPAGVLGMAIESLDPALTLVERAEGATMLVVSSRGLSGVRSLLLGSVSQRCAQRATCPVVIVRSADEPS